ncbi:MAG: class F sortase, partial [Candidatus Komeilibacteria bacterium]|nr:class F sortase [Candidatus Komeilibacteria bacterium]
MAGVLFFIFGTKPNLPSNRQSLLNLVGDQSIEPIRPGLPLRLKIPEINVDSVVEYVALTPDGAMDIPKNIGDVAWFNLGPRPGESGNAVIAGHFGRLKNGE